ncbi:hypothetical protein, partial [Klebsiella variicola]|uniref:hypothetical protein n=1 Tax=Klebsiella variicola TaxID=244366 RepID=UPI001955249D
ASISSSIGATFTLLISSSLPYRRPAERYYLLRIDISTSSRHSYAPGSYFVGVLPWWVAAGNK